MLAMSANVSGLCEDLLESEGEHYTLTSAPFYTSAHLSVPPEANATPMRVGQLPSSEIQHLYPNMFTQMQQHSRPASAMSNTSSSISFRPGSSASLSSDNFGTDDGTSSGFYDSFNLDLNEESPASVFAPVTLTNANTNALAQEQQVQLQQVYYVKSNEPVAVPHHKILDRARSTFKPIRESPLDTEQQPLPDLVLHQYSHYVLPSDKSNFISLSSSGMVNVEECRELGISTENHNFGDIGKCHSSQSSQSMVRREGARKTAHLRQSSAPRNIQKRRPLTELEDMHLSSHQSFRRGRYESDFRKTSMNGTGTSNCNRDEEMNSQIQLAASIAGQSPFSLEPNNCSEIPSPSLLFSRVMRNRLSPLPELPWAESKRVWELMRLKDVIYKRDPNYFNYHPELESNMRSILLDWLTEVCEVYTLHRESFYLAVDYIDRFLTSYKNLSKHTLQLIGVTALFLASKLEEIYPPKLYDFAYVTDGACSQDCIRDQELNLTKVLNWSLNPMTPVSWLSVFLQLMHCRSSDSSGSPNENRPPGDFGTPSNRGRSGAKFSSQLPPYLSGPSYAGFVYPKFNNELFVSAAQLLDLCILDVESLRFTYSTLAASALYHFTSDALVTHVTGIEWEEISECVAWMVPFVMTTRDHGVAKCKTFSNISSEDQHNIQTHTVNLDMLNEAVKRQELLNASKKLRHSPDCTEGFEGLLTPPQSNQNQKVFSIKSYS